MRRGAIHPNVLYALAVAVLAASATFMEAAHRRGWLVLIKKPLPIRKPLNELNRRALAPFELITAQTLSDDIVQELGTTEYINWLLRAPEGHAQQRTATLSVTYYTGVVDQVPHVPEECFHQGAFTQDSDDAMDMTLPDSGLTIPVRRLSFYPPREIAIRTFVYYTICVNGDFYAGRTPVRARMADFRDTHLFYSKIEVAFKRSSNTSIESLDRQARLLLDKAIAELNKNHFPPAGWARSGGPAAPTASPS